MNTSVRAAMSPADRIAAESGDAILLVARVLVALLFVVYGFNKLMGLGGFQGYLTNLGMPVPAVMAPIGAIIEFFGGLALLLGIKTRYIAALLALFVLIATGFAHRYWEFEGPARAAQMSNFWKNLVIIGGILAFFYTGGGRYSVDAMWRKS
jgi:putative oxidoreductase